MVFEEIRLPAQSKIGRWTLDHESKPWLIHTRTRTETADRIQTGLKMIGKGFVLFKINSSPTAFYIIKPTCISWLVFKVNKCLKNYRKLQTRRFVYVAEWWRHLSGRIQTSILSYIMSVWHQCPYREYSRYGKSHFSHYAQYSARESSLVPWTERNILTK